MSKEFLVFGDTKVKKNEFHKFRCSFGIDQVNISKIVISNKVLYGKIVFKNLSG